MTPREVAENEVERVLGYLANGRNNSADLPFEAARVRAHIAALRARAEAAVSAMADVTEAVLGERPVGVMRETTLEAVQALRARAEAAETNSAVLMDVLRLVEHVAFKAASACAVCGEAKPRHTEDCRLGHALHGAFRHGTGYRAKVRAELLRELAKERREAASSYRKEWRHRADHDDAIATGYEGQAAREEQG